MPGVLFLDFDGPIFPTKVFVLPENNEPTSKQICAELDLHPYVHYWKADPVAIAMLNKWHDIYPYDLVVSSSWADDWLHQKEHIEGLLFKNALNYTLHKTWRTPRDNYATRHEQIAHWLKLHPEYEDKYIILDDTSSGDGLADKEELDCCGLNHSNVFLVDSDDGISCQQYKTIASKIQQWCTC